MANLAEMSRRVLNDRVFIALEDLAFEWYESEGQKAVRMYNSGATLREMSGVLRPRTPIKDGMDEIWALLMDLGRKGMLGKRLKPLF